MIEHRAGQLFRDHGFPGLADERLAAPEELMARFRQAEILVGRLPGGSPAGFAAAMPLGGWLWLGELSVDPAHGRQGLGGALVVACAGRSAALRLAGVALSTFRDLPFNAPFYRRLGFRIRAPGSVPPALRERFRMEVPPGIDPARRCIMTRANGKDAA